jgi:hypothetical protein
MNTNSSKLPTRPYFLERLHSLEDYIDDYDKPSREALDDAEALTEEMLVAAHQSIDFKDLERRIQARRKVDFDSLARIPIILSELKLPENVVNSPILTIRPIEQIDQMRGFIEALKTNFDRMGNLEIATAIDVSIAGRLGRVLVAASKLNLKVPALVTLVESKLELLDESQLAILWAAVQREFESEHLAPALEPSGSVPRDWLKYDSRESIVEKLAHYIVEMKYKIMHEMADRGLDGFPVNLPAAARIISWQSATASERLNEQELALQVGVARITEIINKLFGRTKDDVALALGIDSNSALLRKDRTLFESSKPKAPALKSLCYELRKLSRITEFLASKSGPVERVLRQYKLGIEIVAPDIIDKLSEKNEIRLQRELAKFLIERDIYAVGTKFGRSETDLVSTKSGNSYILEVKKYSADERLSERRLKAGLVQLQSYMDQHPSSPFGILVVYNFTDSILLAPETWIRGRFRVLAINLQRAPPSGRTRSLTVESGDGSETVSVHLVDT